MWRAGEGRGGEEQGEECRRMGKGGVTRVTELGAEGARLSSLLSFIYSCDMSVFADLL